MGEKVKYFDNQNLVDRINKIPNNLIRASDNTETAICVYFNDVWVLSIPKQAQSIFEIQVLNKDTFMEIPQLELQDIESSVGLWLTTPLEHRERAKPKFRLKLPRLISGKPAYIFQASLDCTYGLELGVEFTTDKELAAKFTEEDLEKFRQTYPLLDVTVDDMKELVE